MHISTRLRGVFFLHPDQRMPRRMPAGAPDSLSPQARNAATMTVPKSVLQKFKIIFEVFGDAMYSVEGTSDYFGTDKNGKEMEHNGVWMDVLVQVGSFQWLGQPCLDITRTYDNCTSKFLE